VLSQTRVAECVSVGVSSAESETRFGTRPCRRAVLAKSADGRAADSNERHDAQVREADNPNIERVSRLNQGGRR
jgi:hypothetical protein